MTELNWTINTNGEDFLLLNFYMISKKSNQFNTKMQRKGKGNGLVLLDHIKILVILIILNNKINNLVII